MKAFTVHYETNTSSFLDKKTKQITMSAKNVHVEKNEIPESHFAVQVP